MGKLVVVIGSHMPLNISRLQATVDMGWSGIKLTTWFSRDARMMIHLVDHQDSHKKPGREMEAVRASGSNGLAANQMLSASTRARSSSDHPDHRVSMSGTLISMERNAQRSRCDIERPGGGEDSERRQVVDLHGAQI